MMWHNFGGPPPEQRKSRGNYSSHRLLVKQVHVLTGYSVRRALALANEARDNVLMDIGFQKRSKLRRLMSTKKFRETRQRLSARNIEEVDDTMLRIQIKEYMDHAESMQRDSKSNHRTAGKIVSFISDFVEFVGEFSGIIEIMRGVDMGYGGAAYAALSFLLAVNICFASSHPLC